MSVRCDCGKIFYIGDFPKTYRCRSPIRSSLNEMNDDEYFRSRRFPPRQERSPRSDSPKRHPLVWDEEEGFTSDQDSFSSDSERSFDDEEEFPPEHDGLQNFPPGQDKDRLSPDSERFPSGDESLHPDDMIHPDKKFPPVDDKLSRNDDKFSPEPNRTDKAEFEHFLSEDESSPFRENVAHFEEGELSASDDE